MASEKTGKIQDKGRWIKGQSGNPRGKPRGARNKVTVLAESLLAEEAEALVKKCVQLALEGQPVALKLCLERILPPIKERSIQLNLQAPHTTEEILHAMGQVFVHVVDGTIGPQEGNTLMNMFAATTKGIETFQLEQRLAALELALQGRAK